LAPINCNDKPILVNIRAKLYTPIFSFYKPETTFGARFPDRSPYRDIEGAVPLRPGGLEEALTDHTRRHHRAVWETGICKTGRAIEQGWAIWPADPSISFRTTVDRPGAAPYAPNGQELVGHG